MEPASDALEAGIVSTKVGYPLSHGGKGPSHRVSSDRDVGLTHPLVLDAEDEEVGNLGLGRWDITGNPRRDKTGRS